MPLHKLFAILDATILPSSPFSPPLLSLSQSFTSGWFFFDISPLLPKYSPRFHSKPTYINSLSRCPSLPPATFPLLLPSSPHPHFNARDINLHISLCPFSGVPVMSPMARGCSMGTLNSNHSKLDLASFYTTYRTLYCLGPARTSLYNHCVLLFSTPQSEGGNQLWCV